MVNKDKLNDKVKKICTFFVVHIINIVYYLTPNNKSAYDG